MSFNHPLSLTEQDDHTMMMMSLLSPSSRKERGRIIDSLRLEESKTKTLGEESALRPIPSDNGDNGRWISPVVDNAINYIRCQDGDVKERQLRSDDKELVLATVVIFQGFMILRYASDRLKDDQEIMQELLNSPAHDGFSYYDYFPLEYVSERLRNDKSFILQVCTTKRLYSKIQYVSDRLRDDPYVVETAARNGCYDALGYASARLRDDRDFYIHLMETNCYPRLRHVSDRLKDDTQLVMMAAESDCWQLHYASTRLRDDRDFVMKLVDIDGNTFANVSDRLKDDFELATKAGCPYYASARLRDDTDFILSLGLDGLLAASRRIKDDKDIVLTVLRDAHPHSGIDRNYNMVWEEISNRLLRDKEVGLALLKVNRESMDGLGYLFGGPDGFRSTNPLLVDPEIVSLSLAPMSPELKPFTGRYWFSSDRDYDFDRGVYSYEPMREIILELDNEATKFGYVHCDPWERIYLVCKVACSIAGHDDDTKDRHHKNYFNLDLRRTIIKFAGLDKCVPLAKEMKRHAEVRSAMNRAGLLSDEGWTKWKSIEAAR